MVHVADEEIHSDKLGNGSSWSRRDEIKESIHTLFSHHPPSHYGHCLRVSLRGHSIYFCARCSGIYGGLGIGILVLLLFSFRLEPHWLWFLFSVALGFATIVDWVSQRVTPRKTRNLMRAGTGFASGIGLAIVFYLANVYYMLLTLAIMMITIGTVSFMENRMLRQARPQQVSIDAE